jgi:DNA polymerase III sliding clamp (beta) subunit (PCNA family)
MLQVKAKMETKHLRRMLNAAVAAADESVFRFGNEGVEFRQMDATQIAIVCAKIPKTQFTEYSVVEQPMDVSALTAKDPNLLCVNAEKLVKTIEKFGDSIEMEVSTGGNRFNFASVVAGVKKRVSVPLLNVEVAGLGKIPQVVPSVIIVMDTADLKRTLKELMDITDASHISLSVAEGVFTITVEGDNNTADVKFDKESPSMKSIEGGAEQVIKSVFPLKALAPLLGAVASPTIILQLSTDKPIIIKDTEWDILAFLAPIVDKN